MLCPLTNVGYINIIIKHYIPPRTIVAKRKTDDELIAEYMATIARLEAKRDAMLQREAMRKEEERRREEQRSKESRLHTRWNSTDRTLTPNDYWVLEMMHAQLERAIQRVITITSLDFY